jgi:prefoldin alpha subunit
MEEVKQQFQQKYLELQGLDKQIKQLQNHFQNMDNQVVELQVVKQSLGTLSDTKLETEILLPMCNGVFVKAAIRENTDVIVNVGANVAVKKTILQAKEMMDAQINEIKKVQRNVLVDLQKLSEQAVSLEKEANALLATLNK